MRVLWPGLHVNFDRSLNTAVNSLRKALGDSSQNSSYIETRPGMGYRFIAPVQEVIPGAPATTHPGLNQNCAKARYFLNKQTQADLHKASAYLQAALEEDPRCVQAYADFVETYCLFALMNMATPEEMGARARPLAAAAMELDHNSAEARAALARVRRFFDWDWAGAAEEFQRALALDANCAAVHRAYGSFLSSIGKMPEALEELRLAQGLDPVSPAIHVEAAWTLYLARDFVAAHEECWKVLILEPSFSAAQHVLGLVYEQMQMCDEAVIEFQNALASGEEQPAVIAALGHGWARAGKTTEAEKMLDQLEGLAAKRYVSPYWRAVVSAGLGRDGAAVECLEKAYEQRDVWLAWLGADPRFDAVRSAPGFQSLLHRMNLDFGDLSDAQSRPPVGLRSDR
jgi:tetratricopeptide (TPR) repeat protein